MDGTLPTPASRRASASLRESGIELGVWIRERRVNLKISQRELADRARISRSYLCDIERGRGTRPSVDALDRIAVALGAERTELLREAGILEPHRGPGETTREQKLSALFRGLSAQSQDALERFAKFLLSEDQHWVQQRLVDDDDHHHDARPTQRGPGLFDDEFRVVSSE